MMRDIAPAIRWRRALPLRPQLFTGSQPTPENFLQPKNDGFIKPKGGLWTSTYTPETGSGWIQWCLAEDFHVPGGGWRSWLLQPDPAARVLEIDTYQDLERAHASYGMTIPGLEGSSFGRQLDYEAIARDFDAIHLTEEGQWRTRLTHPLNLYGWDCEAVLWLRWRFVGVQDLGRVVWQYGSSRDEAEPAD